MMEVTAAIISAGAIIVVTILKLVPRRAGKPDLSTLPCVFDESHKTKQTEVHEVIANATPTTPPLLFRELNQIKQQNEEIVTAINTFVKIEEAAHDLILKKLKDAGE